MKNKNYFTGTPFENIKGEVEIEFQNETYLAEVFFGENPHVNIWEGNTIIFVLKKDEKKGWICFTFFGNHKLEVCIDIQEITVKILIK